MGDLRIIRAVAVKEIIELRRDPVTLGVAFVLPLVLLFIFGYALTMDVREVPIAVLDLDQTPASLDYARRIDSSREFRLLLHGRGPTGPEDLLDRGLVRVVVRVPSGFARALEGGTPTSVQTLIDGSFAATAQIVRGYVEVLHESFVREYTYPAPAPPVEIDIRVWYNPSLRSVTSIVPGLFGVILMAIPPLLTALAVVREKERGSIRQIYVSPVRPLTFVLGKLLPYAVVAFADMFLVVSVGTAWFDIPLEGSPWFLAGASLLYVLSTVSIGLLVSTITSTQVVALLLIVVLTVMPSLLFSGFMFPIFNMPWILQGYTYLFPGRYFVELSRGIVLKGLGPQRLYPELVAIAGYGALMVILASWRLRTRLE